MRIDVLKTTPDRAGRYFVHMDSGETLRLYRQTIEDFGLYAGMELSEDTYASLCSAAEEMSAKMRAVRIISASNVSKKDLEKRLIQKGEKPSKAKQAVSWLEDLSLLDDRKTAEQIVHSCAAKGYGLARAKQALYEKRIPKDLWDDALADYSEQRDVIGDYLKLRLSASPDMRELKKAVDGLIRRGHSYRVIREVLNELSLDSEDFPEDT